MLHMTEEWPVDFGEAPGGRGPRHVALRAAWTHLQLPFPRKDHARELGARVRPQLSAVSRSPRPPLQFARLASCRYGMGGLGTGATPQISGAHGGSGGVGISVPLPCLEGEQFGSVAGLQVMQLPVKVSLLG